MLGTHKDYLRVSVTAPARFSEALADAASELGTLGSVDHGDDPGRITFFFAPGTEEGKVLAGFRAVSPEGHEDQIRVEFGDEAPRDWERAWREALHPIRVGRTWVVRTSWHPELAYRGRDCIVIDPKMAFGTGTHATTQLCLEELERLALRDKQVLDLGTGTGILAIAAAKRGAGNVVAVDVDEEAVACAQENSALNGVSGIVQTVTGTVSDVQVSPFDVIIANIEYRTLTTIAEALRWRITPDGVGVFSGILQQEADAFVQKIAAAGWTTVRRRRRFDPGTNDGWVCCVACPSRQE